MNKNVLIAIATLLSTWSWGLVTPQDALGATFRYQTTVTDTRLSENPTSVNGVLYDGTFENFIKNGSKETRAIRHVGVGTGRGV